MNPKPELSSPVARVSKPAPFRILIVDDHAFFSECLRTLIEEAFGPVVCGVVSAEHGLAHRIQELRPDVLVLDLSVGHFGGFEVGRALRRRGVHVPILFVSTANGLPRRQLARIPAVAFAPKDGKPSFLLASIRKLAETSESDGLAVVEDAESWELAEAAIA